MPTLLGFLACERVIFEEQTHKATLIGVLHDVYIPVIRTVPIPENTLAPLNWAAFTMWYWASEDAGVTYDQVVTLVGEKGETLIQSDPLRFTMDPSKPVLRLVSPFTHIPVYKPGHYVLQLHLRTLMQPNGPWQVAMSYPFNLHHTYYPI